jgi:opacity protein-like surface antigen
MALDIGAGVEIPMGQVAVVLEGLYSRGLTNIVPGAEGDDFEDVKTRTFRVSAGLRF